MKNKINGIWLTNSGSLHPQIIPNLSSWVNAAAPCDFEVVLWTNTSELKQSEKELLEAQNIIVKDHSACKTSFLYKYFLFFLEKGLQGDKAAFALASDVLRMAILELTADNEYFIYVDPNDVVLFDLKIHLSVLDMFMNNNSFGFAFYIEKRKIKNVDLFHIRNDVLIACKALNPNFFNEYLKAYQQHLEDKHKLYFKPETDKQAQELAREITNQISTAFFEILICDKIQIPPVIATKFGNFKEFDFLVNCVSFFPHERKIEHGNTWLPIGELAEEKEWREKLYELYDVENMATQDYCFELKSPSININAWASSESYSEFLVKDSILSPPSSGPSGHLLPLSREKEAPLPTTYLQVWSDNDYIFCLDKLDGDYISKRSTEPSWNSNADDYIWELADEDIENLSLDYMENLIASEDAIRLRAKILSLMSGLYYPFKMLAAPPEKKSLTLPGWKEKLVALQNPSLSHFLTPKSIEPNCDSNTYLHVWSTDNYIWSIDELEGVSENPSLDRMENLIACEDAIRLRAKILLLMSGLYYSCKMLAAPPEKKLLTLPDWKEKKLTLQNSSLSHFITPKLTFFNSLSRAFLAANSSKLLDPEEYQCVRHD